MSHSPEAHAQFASQLIDYIEQATVDVPRTALPFILTHSGKKYYHADPRPEDIVFDDVAHALSRLCRFTGHVDVPHYSVAQHSYYVSLVCNKGEELDGLLHDATEAYVADMSSPLKRAPGMEAYKYYEDLTAQAVAWAFNIEYPTPESVHKADLILGLMEMRDLFDTPEPREWAMAKSAEWNFTLPTWPIMPWTQQEAEYMFRARYDDLQMMQMKALRAVSRDTKY